MRVVGNWERGVSHGLKSNRYGCSGSCIDIDFLCCYVLIKEFIDFHIFSLYETRIGTRLSKINKNMKPISAQFLLKYRIARINM